MAYDKVKKRHFIYFNRVIKPALVGLAGPWISGGIEFNWPQHHRPSTYQPVSGFKVDPGLEDDGFKTTVEKQDVTVPRPSGEARSVHVSEVEQMFRTQGSISFVLYPDT